MNPIYSSEDEAFRRADRLRILTGRWPGVLAKKTDPPSFQLTWDPPDPTNIGRKGYENT